MLAGLLPWFPILYGEVVWTYRHYSWLALFYVLVVSQVGHFLEHVAQMTQIHFLGLTGPAAQGVFGALNIEWVHFVFNTWVIVAVPVVLYRFRTNPWLWVTLIIAAWHELEHLVIMTAYLSSGKPGTPGLLAQGGVIGGGLPLTRADLHFLYNLLETIPLVGAFVDELLRRCPARPRFARRPPSSCWVPAAGWFGASRTVKRSPPKNTQRRTASRTTAPMSRVTRQVFPEPRHSSVSAAA